MNKVNPFITLGNNFYLPRAEQATAFYSKVSSAEFTIPSISSSSLLQIAKSTAEWKNQKTSRPCRK